jgi:hypothetical protein
MFRIVEIALIADAAVRNYAWKPNAGCPGNAEWDAAVEINSAPDGRPGLAGLCVC